MIYWLCLEVLTTFSASFGTSKFLRNRKPNRHGPKPAPQGITTELPDLALRPRGHHWLDHYTVSHLDHGLLVKFWSNLVKLYSIISHLVSAKIHQFSTNHPLSIIYTIQPSTITNNDCRISATVNNKNKVQPTAAANIYSQQRLLEAMFTNGRRTVLPWDPPRLMLLLHSH